MIHTQMQALERGRLSQLDSAPGQRTVAGTWEQVVHSFEACLGYFKAASLRLALHPLLC